MDKNWHKSWILIFLIVPLAFGTLGDQELNIDGAKLIFNDNSQQVSIEASDLATETYAIILPVADGEPSQAIITDGFGRWSFADVNAVAGTHKLLSVTHTDTTGVDVTRGSLIYGNSMPKWDEFVIGLADKFLMSDGTDIIWSFIDISDSTNLAVTTPITLTDDSIGIVNQGTTTTVLHGNAAGNASFGIVDISDDTNLTVNTDHFKLTDDEIDFSDFQEDNIHVWQGSFNEQIDGTITESGGVITYHLEKEGGGDLTMFFSDEFTVLDCTPNCTETLTAGTATTPKKNFVYILQSDKLLTHSDSGWPVDVEHLRVGTVVLRSAAVTATDGALGNQNWNDFKFGITEPRGHGLHITQRLRAEHAKYDFETGGIALSVTGSGTSTITIAVTTGKVYQLHLQTFPALNLATGDDLHIVNQSGNAYQTTTDMTADITADSGGNVWGNNKSFNIVIWGIQNKSGETSHLMCNLPSGFYGGGANGQADAIIDASKFDNFTIPNEFIGSGFLIARLTFLTSGGGATWTLIDSADLRGLVPSQTAGSGIGQNISAFSDTDFEVFDDADISKEFGFQLSGVTAGMKRIVTIPDANGIIAYTSQTDGTIDHGADLSSLGWTVSGHTGTAKSLPVFGNSGEAAELGLGAALEVPQVDATGNFIEFTDLKGITGLTPTNSNFMVGNGAGTAWVAESGATARTSLGLGTGDNVEFESVKVDDTTINGNTITSTDTLDLEGTLQITLDASGNGVSFSDEALMDILSLDVGNVSITGAAISFDDADGGDDFAINVTNNSGDAVLNIDSDVGFTMTGGADDAGTGFGGRYYQNYIKVFDRAAAVIGAFPFSATRDFPGLWLGAENSDIVPTLSNAAILGGANTAFGSPGTSLDFRIQTVNQMRVHNNGGLSVGNVGFTTTPPADGIYTEGVIRAQGGFNDAGSAGLSATYTFGGGGTGDIATMTFSGGILTAVTTVP